MKADKGQHPPGNPGLHLIGGSYDAPPAHEAALDAKFVQESAFAIAATKGLPDVDDVHEVAAHVAASWLNRSKSDPEFLRDRDKVMAFIETSVRNRLVDIWRRRRVHRKAEPTLIVETEGNLTTPDPQTKVEIEERKDDVNRALEKLAPKRRRICAMFYLDQAERQEIADALGIALRTVDKHVELGNADLRRLLHKYAPRMARREGA